MGAGTAYGSEWMARLRVGLAAVALIAACRRGEPTTTSGPPANVPGPDAAEPRWSVEIVERPSLATYPALDIRAVYPDGDVLVVPPAERTAQMALERRGPGGVLRWRTVWKDHRDFHVAVTARDTWVLALGERPLRVSPRTQLAIDDPGPNPLALARLRSTDGVIEATTVLVPHIPIEERRFGLEPAMLLPHEGGLVVLAPGPDLRPLQKFDHDLALVATIPIPEAIVRNLVGLDASTRGEVCVRLDDPRRPAMWCLDRNLANGRLVPYPDGAYEVWHDGPKIVGWRTKGPATGYRVDVAIPNAPPLIIQSICQWRVERTIWDVLRAPSCEDNCPPPPPPPCPDTMISPFAMMLNHGAATLTFDITAAISIAGHEIDVAGDTLAVLTLGPGPRARLQLFPGCRWLRAGSDARFLTYCPPATLLHSTQ